jgi:hypothetical protein
VVLNVITEGLVPAAKGLPAMAVSAPVVRLSVYAETLFEPAFATYANSSPTPLENEITAGSEPAAKGLPAMAVSAPVVPMIAL